MAVALAALLALGVAVTVAGTLGQPAVTVERSGEAEEPEQEQDPGADETRDDGQDEGSETLVVHVDGAVAAPGVYELPASARANDAVLAAGGLLPEADTTGLNLAAPLSDGEKLHVPVVGEEPVAETQGSQGSDQTADGQDALVNINTADIAALDELPGVGEATARAIIEDREANGPFSTPEDLMRVSGIGEKKFAKIKDMICV